MRKYLICFLSLGLSLSVFAQGNHKSGTNQRRIEQTVKERENQLRENSFNGGGQSSSSFDDFKKERDERFSDFVQHVGAEFSNYAERMRQTWEVFIEKRGEEMPAFPKPKNPIYKPKGDNKLTKLPTKGPVKLPAPIPSAPDSEPVVVLPIPKDDYFGFDFYNTKCAVAMGKEYDFSLSQIDETHCADVWSRLSAIDNAPLVNSCMVLQNDMNLGDWGFIELTRELAEKYYKDNNSATLFRYFLLSLMGYDVRIGRGENELCLYVSFVEHIFKKPYVSIDGKSYYGLSEYRGSCSILNMPIKGTRPASLFQPGSPVFEYTKSHDKIIEFRDERVVINANKNLVDFYNKYPLNMHWEYYSMAALGEETETHLRSFLNNMIAGKDEIEAVNLILRFVQYGFKYQTDEDQFGYERPLFGEESLFYPYNDCEDRAILFSHLVKEFLGLDVLLLLYPQHLSAAVKLSKDIVGAYYVVDGSRYYSCDPTYIGACAGDVMPQFEGVKASFIPICVPNSK